MNKVLIIVPAFNEEANMSALFNDLCTPEIRSFADILVVNDASMDQTGLIAKNIMSLWLPMYLIWGTVLPCRLAINMLFAVGMIMSSR